MEGMGATVTGGQCSSENKGCAGFPLGSSGNVTLNAKFLFVRKLEPRTSWEWGLRAAASPGWEALACVVVTWSSASHATSIYLPRIPEDL